MNRQYNKADVNSWLSRAKDDLKWASSSLKDGFYPQTCFIAQQVVEKSLKAIIYSLQEEFSTEDIKKLNASCLGHMTLASWRVKTLSSSKDIVQ